MALSEVVVKRDRKAAEVRKAEILDAGADLLIDQGDGPCGTGAGVSSTRGVIHSPVPLAAILKSLATIVVAAKVGCFVAATCVRGLRPS